MLESKDVQSDYWEQFIVYLEKNMAYLIHTKYPLNMAYDNLVEYFLNFSSSTFASIPQTQILSLGI